MLVYYAYTRANLTQQNAPVISPQPLPVDRKSRWTTIFTTQSEISTVFYQARRHIPCYHTSDGVNHHIRRTPICNLCVAHPSSSLSSIFFLFSPSFLLFTTPTTTSLHNNTQQHTYSNGVTFLFTDEHAYSGSFCDIIIG